MAANVKDSPRRHRQDFPFFGLTAPKPAPNAASIFHRHHPCKGSFEGPSVGPRLNCIIVNIHAGPFADAARSSAFKGL